MNKDITSLDELRSFAEKVAEVRLDPQSKTTRVLNNHFYKEYAKKVGFWAQWKLDYSTDCVGALCAHYDKMYDESLPTTIKLTPQIAYVLAEDENTFQSKASVARSNDSSLKDFAIGSGLGLLTLLFPNPHTGVTAATNIGKSFVSMHSYGKQMEKFSKERNQIAKDILSLYEVAEAKSGQYILQRVKWSIGFETVGYGKGASTEPYPNLHSNGLSQNFNLPKLRELVISEAQKKQNSSKNR